MPVTMATAVGRPQEHVLWYQPRILVAWLLTKTRLALAPVFLVCVILGVRLSLRTIMADSGTDLLLQRLSDEQRLILAQNDAVYKNQRQYLLDQIATLEETLNKRKPAAGRTTGKTGSIDKMSSSERLDHYRKLSHDNTHLMTSGIKYNTEYDVDVYEFYNGTHILSSMVGMGVGQVSPVVGRQAVALQEVVTDYDRMVRANEGRARLDSAASSTNVLYRFINGVGESYLVQSKPKMSQTENGLSDTITETSPDLAVSADDNSDEVAVRISLVRPFGPLELVGVTSVLSSVPINIILPLSSSRVGTLGQFISNLNYAAGTDRALSLTVVYFGTEDKKKIEQLFSGNSMSVHLVMMHEPFDRMLGLREGAKHWNGSGEVIVLLADVDLVMTRSALSSCRYHVTRGQSVYYPMVFGLFNPKLTYRIIHHEKVPPLHQQLRINHDKGRWQHEIYDVSCQYKTDLLKMTNHLELGHDRDLGTWPYDDEELYTKYIQSTYKVHRVPDPGYFHVYHTRDCAAQPQRMFTRCMRNKAYSAGSHTQLGFVAFH